MAPDESAEANDALVRGFLAAWERRDTAFILDRLSEDAVYHAMPLTPIVGKDALDGMGQRVRGRTARATRGAPPGRVG